MTSDIGLCAKSLIFVVIYEISMYGICITGHLDMSVVKILQQNLPSVSLY